MSAGVPAANPELKKTASAVSSTSNSAAHPNASLPPPLHPPIAELSPIAGGVVPRVAYPAASPQSQGSVARNLRSRHDSGDSALFYSILVHNLSHSDLALGLRAPDSTAAAQSTCQPPLPPSIVSRPKFNKFKAVSGRILNYVETNNAPLQSVEFPSPLISQLSLARSASAQPLEMTTNMRDVSSSSTAGNTAAAAAAVSPATSSPVSAAAKTCPYGFRVAPGQLRFNEWDAFKLKDSEWSSADARPSKAEVVAVFFPLLAVLIPRWLSIVAAKNASRGIKDASSNRKILYLISGAGTPWNEEHDASTNSTKGVGRLADIFVKHFYPQVEVQILHSGVEIFHYDANVHFVNKELKPKIEEKRRHLAEQYGDKWPRYLHLVVSLTDGAPARISAINAGLRHLRPDSLHMWQLKSFWHEYPAVTGSGSEQSVEYHQFEKIEMTPPTLVSETDNWTKMLVKEMIAHKEEYERVRDSHKYNELGSFWLRKSKQPTLSVLMVKKKNQGFKFYRGINVEVSMPTGSLCSERNAIGSALSVDPSLQRKDLRMIAVLAVGIEPYSTTSTLDPHKPIPKELIPLASTAPYTSTVSPHKTPMSPRGYPRAADGTTAVLADGVSPADEEVCAANAHLDARPSFNRANSERQPVRRGANSPAGKARKAPSAPSSPHHGSQQQRSASPAKAPLNETDVSTAAAIATTPRKRKAGLSPAGAAAELNASLASGSATPPMVSPRCGRQPSFPAVPLPPSAIPPAAVSSTHARSLVDQLNQSTQPSAWTSPPPPAVDSSMSASASMPAPASPRVTRAAAAAASGGNTVTFADGTAGDSSRPNKRPKLTRSATTLTQSLNPSATPVVDTPISMPSSSPPPVYSAGGVDKHMVSHYLRHEFDMIRHRDALVPSTMIPLLSGNSAPGSVHPVDRPLIEELTLPSAAGGIASITHADERNPINPCGACNEWLKKIAEVNPDFRVVTFTSTDCTTCFIKSVKF